MAQTNTLRVADLDQNAETSFELRPDAAVCAALAEELNLLGLRKLSLIGKVAAQGGRDWLLTARFGATVVQACVVSLEPVTTRIDADVRRLYLSDLPEPESLEVEMPEDDSLEPLPKHIDLDALLAEALALNLPLYPRKEGIDLGEAQFAAPGVEPLTDEAVKPFAGLAQLRDKLGKGS